MSIAVTTIIGDNYGSALQAYALQQTFIEYGEDSHLLRIATESNVKKYLKLVLKSKDYESLKKTLYKVKSDYKNRKKIGKVKGFYQDKIHIHEYSNIKDLEKGEKDTRLFCCGSDQVWNPNFQPSELMYVDFITRKDAFFFSYAASIAVTEINEINRHYYKIHLNKFSKISVREDEGKIIMDDIFPEKDVRIDVDPVLLKNKEYWSKHCSGRFTNQKYILLYMLRPLDWMVDVALEYANAMDLPIYYMGDYHISNKRIISIYDAGVEDFLDIIMNASLVLTNSFHATAFSVLFEKDFYSYAVSGTGSRVVSLLSKLDLSNRLLNLEEDFKSSEKAICWDSVKEKLEILRNDSLSYIKSIVSKDEVT